MRRLFITTLIVAAVPTIAAGQNGQIILKGHTQLPNAVIVSDVCGYVEPGTGKEFAIVGDITNARLWVVDVTDPTDIEVTASLGSAPSYDVKVTGHFVVGCDGDGIGSDSRVVDLSDPYNPVVAFVYLPSARNLGVTPDGTVFFSTRGVEGWNMANPLVPIMLWRDGFGETIDTKPVGNRLYDFRGRSGFFIWDITDRANPVELYSVLNRGVEFAESGYPTADHNYLYVCDDQPSGADEKDITIWNISSVPDTAYQVGYIDDPLSRVHNLYIIDDYAYVAYYAAGFQVFDVSNPAQPVHVDTYDTYPGYGEEPIGVIGVYPFAPSGNIYVTDTESGLYLFEFDPSATPTFIRRFDAVTTGQRVALSWLIVSDDHVLGYRVYRTEIVRGTPSSPRASALIAPDVTEYVDRDVEPGKVYEYVLNVVRADMANVRSRPERVAVPSTKTVLAGNYPNPFTSDTTIRYTLAAPGEVSLTVYDVRGRVVSELMDADVTPGGEHAFTWDRRDRSGHRVAAGVYYYRLSAGGVVRTRSMVARD